MIHGIIQMKMEYVTQVIWIQSIGTDRNDGRTLKQILLRGELYDDNVYQHEDNTLIVQGRTKKNIEKYV